MKVRDLIGMLQALPLDLEVVAPFPIDDGVYGHASIETYEVSVRKARRDGATFEVDKEGDIDVVVVGFI